MVTSSWKRDFPIFPLDTIFQPEIIGHFNPEGLGVATKNIEWHVARAGGAFWLLPAWIVCAAVDELGKCSPKKYKSDCEMGNTTKTW